MDGSKIFTFLKKSEDDNPCADELQFKHCDIMFSVVGIRDTVKGNSNPGWYTDGLFTDNSLHRGI